MLLCFYSAKFRITKCKSVKIYSDIMIINWVTVNILYGYKSKLYNANSNIDMLNEYVKNYSMLNS